MLYIWPLFAFFSFPLLLPSLLSAITRPIPYLQSLLGAQTTRSALISLPYTALTILLSLAVVRYNTIIHPFTLADNRHYMFYIFRYTIRRSAAIRLALVPVYTLARWLVWDALTPQPNQQHPTPSTSTSTALLWLLTTALSLITAPLVEPRYFILPWIFYRLLVPSQTLSAPPPPPPRTDKSDSKSTETTAQTKHVVVGGPARFAREIDVRLALETVWFVVVNAVTMWVFLTKGFYWRGEDGAVADGGRVQRFMW